MECLTRGDGDTENGRKKLADELPILTSCRNSVSPWLRVKLPPDRQDDLLRRLHTSLSPDRHPDLLRKLHVREKSRSAFVPRHMACRVFVSAPRAAFVPVGAAQPEGVRTTERRRTKPQASVPATLRRLRSAGRRRRADDFVFSLSAEPKVICRRQALARCAAAHAESCPAALLTGLTGFTGFEWLGASASSILSKTIADGLIFPLRRFPPSRRTRPERGRG